MPKGKPWPAEKERQLEKLVATCKSLKVIAAEMGKSTGAIREKAKRMGLKVVVVNCTGQKTTTSFEIPKELPSVEDALKILAGALNRSAKPSLDRVEVQRLQVIATLARTYKQLFVDYVNYREIEAKLIELDEKYEKLVQDRCTNS